MQKDNPFGKLYEECLNASAENQPEFPLIIDVELTTVCNMNCKHCPTGEGILKRPDGFMTWATWYWILGEIACSNTAVRFVRWGEPTLHPELYVWIKMAHIAEALTHLTSNGILLDKEKVFACGLDSLTISGHANHWDLSKPPKKYLPCPKVFSMLAVDWDGDVTACQGDYDKFMTLGNIRDNSLAFYWNCDIMQGYRKMLTEMRHAELPLCKNCARKEGK